MFCQTISRKSRTFANCANAIAELRKDWGTTCRICSYCMKHCCAGRNTLQAGLLDGQTGFAIWSSQQPSRQVEGQAHSRRCTVPALYLHLLRRSAIHDRSVLSTLAHTQILRSGHALPFANLVLARGGASEPFAAILGGGRLSLRRQCLLACSFCEKV
jgi:hypothetical protein